MLLHGQRPFRSGSKFALNYCQCLIQIFNYNSNEVRTVQQNGEPWFVLKDVCAVLGIGNNRMASDRLDADEKGVSQIDTLGGRQEMTVINESGLYNVILRSDKPEAKPFRKWVTSEVLPSIRKHGAYMTQATLQEALCNPDALYQIVSITFPFGRVKFFGKRD